MMNPKTKTLLVILASFILGCIVGASLLSGVWRSATRHTYQRDSYRSYLYDRLDLDSVQAGQVDSLLDAFRASMNSHREALQDSRDSLRAGIKSLLSDSQKVVYEGIIAEMTRRTHRRGADSLKSN